MAIAEGGAESCGHATRTPIALPQGTHFSSKLQLFTVIYLPTALGVNQERSPHRPIFVPQY